MSETNTTRRRPGLHVRMGDAIPGLVAVVFVFLCACSSDAGPRIDATSFAALRESLSAMQRSCPTEKELNEFEGIIETIQNNLGPAAQEDPSQLVFVMKPYHGMSRAQFVKATRDIMASKKAREEKWAGRLDQLKNKELSFEEFEAYVIDVGRQYGDTAHSELTGLTGKEVCWTGKFIAINQALSGEAVLSVVQGKGNQKKPSSPNISVELQPGEFKKMREVREGQQVTYRAKIGWYSVFHVNAEAPQISYTLHDGRIERAQQ